MRIDGRQVGVQSQTTSVSPTLSVIVVSYNSAEVLPGLLDSLKRFPPPDPWELIVVDNNSADDSLACIRSSMPAATVLPQTENHGFAAGVNLGAAQASGDILLIVNPDVQWRGEIFRPLAIVQIGGIVAAGLLSLLVIPAIYVTLCGHRHAEEE